MLVIGLPYTAARRNWEVPPANSMCPLDRTTLRTGRTSVSTVAPNSRHCEGTIKVSTTVRPSSSAITPALVRPIPLGSCSQANTPGASCSSATGPTYAPSGGRLLRCLPRGRRIRASLRGDQDPLTRLAPRTPSRSQLWLVKGRTISRRGLAEAVGLTGAGAGIALAVLAQKRIRRSTRAARTLELARTGSRVGAGWSTHQARRIFASAARKEELDAEFELRSAEEVAAALGNMKGVLMKLGQMASYVDENVPEPIRNALADLQQDAPPMAADLAASVIERELGGPPEKVFQEWDPVPIAAASIGQVHRAITRDDVAVAVKVQYPGVDEAIAADLDN